MIFDAAERPPTHSQAEVKEVRAQLRRRLQAVQARLIKDPSCSVVVTLGGVDGAGKGELANKLCEWMDPRHIDVFAYDDPTAEERQRPTYWRYWRDLPARGRMSMVLSGWHHAPFLGRVYGHLEEDDFTRDLARMNDFECTLARDGVLIVKLWMHLGRRQQEERFRQLERDPLRCWRVTDQDWRHWNMYDDFVRVAEQMLRGTSTDAARWSVVPGAIAEHRDLVGGQALLDALEARLDRGAAGGQVNGHRYHEVVGRPMGPVLP